MKTELHYYDIFPKVVVSGRKTRITVKPLGWHAAFPENCRLEVCPLDEGLHSEFPGRVNDFQYDVTPDTGGCIRFEFDFFGEQEFFIRITAENGFKVQLCVFAVKEDLAGRYPFRGDLHIHSRHSDGKEAPAIVCANYRKSGYDFLAVTDHGQFGPSLEAIKAYRDAPIEMTLVTGEEVHLPSESGQGHINKIHYINFGSDYSINSLAVYAPRNADTPKKPEKSTRPETPVKPEGLDRDPPPPMLAEEYWAAVDKYAGTLNIPDGIEKFTYASCHWICNEIRKANGLAIFVHPYWISSVFQIPPQFVDYVMETRPFDAFEVLGGEGYYEQNGFQTIQYYEDRAKGRIYPIVGSSDSHGSIMVDKPSPYYGATIVFARENERKSLISSIKEMYTVAVDNISKEPRYVGELRLVRYACFLEKEFFPLHDELCFEEGRAMKDYACGVGGARETLGFLYGRMKAQREKYFAF